MNDKNAPVELARQRTRRPRAVHANAGGLIQTRPVGFSTGALARSDFRAGLKMLSSMGLEALELSALRERELGPLLDALGTLDLNAYPHVSLHAPSHLENEDEETLVAGRLFKSVPETWPIIVHADMLQRSIGWLSFGNRLCIENNDPRKDSGRTADEMDELFTRFPDASFCLDLAHARLIDPTMREARFMLEAFGDRLREIHISEIDVHCAHRPISTAALEDYRPLIQLVPDDVPFVIESIVSGDDIAVEIAKVRALLA